MRRERFAAGVVVLLLGLSAAGCASPAAVTAEGAPAPTVVGEAAPPATADLVPVVTDGPTPPSSVMRVDRLAGEPVRILDDGGKGITVSADTPERRGDDWLVDVHLTDVPPGYRFSPLRISIDDYVDTWVYPTSSVLDGVESGEDRRAVSAGEATVTLRLSGPPPTTGVISYHGTGESVSPAPEWRYTLPQQR